MQCTDKHILPTVYIHLRRNRLCLREYWSKRTIRHHFVCNSPFMRRKRVLARCVRGTFCVCVCASVSALRKPDRIELAYVPQDRSIGYDTVRMYTSYLLTTQQIRSEWISSQKSLPNIFVLFLFIDENYDFRHSFCHSKRVLVRYRLVFVSGKNVIDENYDEYYSSTKLTCCL